METHNRLLKNQLSLMEDEFREASIDELVEHCVVAKVRRQTSARSRKLRNPTVGQLVRYFRRSEGGVGGGHDLGLGGKMVLLGPARVLAVEQPT